MNSHPVVMFEVIAKDQARLLDFYHAVFGWEFDIKGGFAYINFEPATMTTLGGIGETEPDVPGYERGRNFYLATDDLDANLAAVTDHGGAVYVAPPAHPVDRYRYAMFTDPEGNIVGLLEVSSGS